MTRTWPLACILCWSFCDNCLKIDIVIRILSGLGLDGRIAVVSKILIKFSLESMKTLITADDFGFSNNINQAIIEAYQENRVTELSLMVDCYGSQQAFEYIRTHRIKTVGLHFSLCRLSQDNHIPQGKAFDHILDSWSQKKLISAFDQEVKIFVDQLGFTPAHIIGHKQIALHPKLIKHIAAYCVTNNCYARKSVNHATLQPTAAVEDINLGRTVDRILGFHYGSPQEMYQAYQHDLHQAQAAHSTAVEILFHPGYPREFEKPLTSFIQQRLDDINFLLSDYFGKLVEEMQLELVASNQI